MTTFTITCPPTLAATTTARTVLSSASGVALDAVDDSFPSFSLTQAQTFIRASDNQSNIIITDSQSGASTQFFPEDFGGGNDVFWLYNYIDTFNNRVTQSWDGARTVIINETRLATFDEGDGPRLEEDVIDTTLIWTAEQTTSSQTTTTHTDTVYKTSTAGTTNVTTRTGTLVQSGTMTSPEPRTTITQTAGFTVVDEDLFTTRVTTTTQEDTYNIWKLADDQQTQRGTFQSATVVVLETSNMRGIHRPEVAWIVTNRPDFTDTNTNIYEQQSITQFTVFPTFSITQGHVEDGVVSAEVIETPETYKTTVATGATISIAQVFGQIFNEIPSPLNEQVGTTRTTEEWFSTIRETLYTGGDVSTTTIFTTTTHQEQIGDITWNATHRQSTTALTLFSFETANTATGLTEFIDGEVAYTETNTVTFERPITIGAQIHAPFISQDQCGSSLSFAVAAASNVSSVGRSINADPISVKFPPSVNVALTARAPLGQWSYVTDGTTVSASAGPAGLSVSSSFGPSSAITTTSTEAAWAIGGSAVSRANLPFLQRINLGGTPPTGAATAFYNAGVFSTTNESASGTVEISEARTEIIDPQAPRVAYLPATGVFIYGEQRFNTSARNITSTISEDALITNRFQLVL
jgi:hypothetical protein